MRRVVLDAAPEAVIDELTSLPRDFNLRDPHLYDANDEIRSKGTPALHDAAREAGVRRFVMQSVAFLYAPEGDWVKPEDAPMWLDAPGPFARSVRVLHDNEQRITSDPDIEGVVLRYGFFYGPGTYYASDGSIAAQVRKRQLPIVGRGAGMNVVRPRARRRDRDRRRARARQRDLQHRRRRAGPRARLAARVRAGDRREAAAPRPDMAGSPRRRQDRRRMANEMRGASNAKAKAELGWQPALPSWREGFTTALDSGPVELRTSL